MDYWQKLAESSGGGFFRKPRGDVLPALADSALAESMEHVGCVNASDLQTTSEPVGAIILFSRTKKLGFIPTGASSTLIRCP